MNLYEVYDSITHRSGGSTFEEIFRKTGGANSELAFYLGILIDLKRIKKNNIPGLVVTYFKTFGTS